MRLWGGGAGSCSATRTNEQLSGDWYQRGKAWAYLGAGQAHQGVVRVEASGGAGWKLFARAPVHTKEPLQGHLALTGRGRRVRVGVGIMHIR